MMNFPCCWFQEVKANPMNYDAWFDYLRLLEVDGNMEQIRETYERAISNVPPSKVIEMTVLVDRIRHKFVHFNILYLL